MKKHIILVTVVYISIFISSAQAQDYFTNYFILKDSKVIWQKVFTTSMSFEKLVEYFKETGIMENMEVVNNKIMGDVKPFKGLYNESGFTYMETNYFILEYGFYGFGVIEFKEGKYRVSFKNILLPTDSIPNIKCAKTIESEVLNYNYTQFKDFFLRNSSKILDYTLSKMFDVKEVKEENW